MAVFDDESEDENSDSGDSDNDDDDSNGVGPSYLFHNTTLILNTYLVCGYFCLLVKSLQTVWTQFRTDKKSVLIWVQTVWHSVSVSKRTFEIKIGKNGRWEVQENGCV